ncbi:MAG: hypothetical protein PVH96_12945 [Gemmatimonadota bacterium]|jgi:hypothetical protein
MESGQRVVVTDVEMRFGSMVAFMVKWTIAAIPAMLILLVLFWVAVVASGVLLAVLFPDLMPTG